MALAGTRVFLALDALSVSAAAVSEGLAGGRRLRSFARQPLAKGALCVSASAANFVRPEEVRGAVRRVLDSVGRGRVTLVLPEGIARLTMVELPPDADAREFARFRLAPSLPWPAADAVVETVPLGRGRVIAAAVRRATVAEYEQLLDGLAAPVDRVHLAGLLALSGLARRKGRHDRVHVLLGDAAVSFVAVRGGRIAAVRSRLRDSTAGEAARLAAEAMRTAILAGDGAAPQQLEWSGADAARLCRESGSGEVAPASTADDAAGAVSWLGGALS